MRRFNMLMLFSMMIGAVQAQFINNGATVTIQSGATLRVETDFTNTAGTINNSGTLEVQGNLLNSATITSAAGSKVRFIGTTNSNVTSGGAVLQNVDMAKTSENITLLDPMAVAGTLDFPNANNRIVLGANNLTIQPTGSLTNGGTGKYVATTGAGKLIKSVAAASTINMEVGDATNYTPVSNVIAGSAFASATLSARAMTTGLTTKYVGTTDFIAREWQVEAGGITGYGNTMTGTYVAGDVTGSAALVKGATYHTMDWFFNGSAGNGSSTVTASTGNTDVRLSGKNFFGKVNLKAFLQGAYSGGTMTTTLNSAGILEANALTSPYLDAPASVSAGFFAAHPTIVDWVKIEARDVSAPSTPTVFTASAFIKSNGDIVGIDGASLPVIKNAYPTSIVVLSHRNHLPIRTVDAGLNLVSPSSHSFSSGLAQAYTSPSVMTNASMKDESGTFVMWAGNGNSNSSVNYGAFGSDRVALLTNPNTPGLARGLGNVQTGIINSVYGNNDFNMNGTINYGTFGSDRVFLLSNVLGNNQTKILNQHL